MFMRRKVAPVEEVLCDGNHQPQEATSNRCLVGSVSDRALVQTSPAAQYRKMQDFEIGTSCVRKQLEMS